MNKERLSLWVAALRSGKYRQTGGQLARTESGGSRPWPAGYCCLGVLCEIAIKHGIIKNYDHEHYYPPDPVAKWLELGDSTYPGDYPLFDEAAALNDKEGMDFLQIADKLEEEYLDPESG